jgi:outer membrane protein OmpA-like peptidoglycan-associated protein/ABC-type nitrate/sulfonate/bicarbonate transport system substrate-binding protein
MFKNMKALPRAILIGVGVVGLIFAGKAVMKIDVVAKYVAPAPTIATSVPDKIDIPTSGKAGTAVEIGGPVLPGMKTIRVKTLPWNGNSGAMYAQAAGLYKARGLNVEFVREDDYSKMMADMAAFAKDPSKGVHFSIIMGDGYPAFKIGADTALKAVGAGTVRNIAGIGFSRGEDKCILADGAEVRGSLIAGYLGDGDINICIKYAADNGIPINADPKVYNRNAMNFVGTGSFVEADQKFIASAMKDFKGGACVDLRDSETGKMVNVCVNGTATWTPGDSNVFGEFAKMGKSIRVLASTLEYDTQMTTAVIGNNEWMKANRDTVLAFLAATLEGGDKVKSDPAALMIAAGMQAKVNGEQDASYWASMFKSVTETMPNGKQIRLGGSTTIGLADSAKYFGLNGADNLYKIVYNVYGKISVKYFPDIMPGGLVKYEDAVDSSYLQDLLKAAKGPVTPTAVQYSAATTQTFASKSVSIEFETGKATFTPKAIAVLNEVLDNAAVTSLNVQINGHTDTKGDPDQNLELSKARAEAVKKFLMTNAPTSFPAERVQTRGFGQTMPIGTDAQNRRVEILLRK